VPDFLTDPAGLGVGAEGLLAAVLEAAAQPIWVVDGGGVIRLANPAAAAALGYERASELVGRRSEALHDQTPHPAAAVVRDLEWLARRDGSKLPVSSVAIAMPEERGAVVAFTDVEDRLRAEQALEAREDSLRRIAALVAGGATSADVLAAIAREVGHVVGLPVVVVLRFDPDQTSATVIGGWSEFPQPFQAGTRWPLDGPTLLVRVLQTGRPARIDDYTEVPGTIAAAGRASGFRAAAAAPIIVDGAVWGAITATSGSGAPLPDHLEDRLAELTELVATAIANTARRDQLARLADEQAALRRVATLVARGTSPEELFAAVAREVGRVLGVEWTHMARYEPDGATIGVAGWSPDGDELPVGIRVEPDGKTVRGLVRRTGRPARVHSYEHASGHAAALAHERGLRSSVGAPIVVAGRLWGVMMAASKDERPLPADAESRLESFTELAATAIANIEAREEVGRLVDEQAALRRVATLVAEGAAPAEVFETVIREVGILCGADLARMAIFTTARSSGWCTRSSRSSSRSTPWRTKSRTSPGC
jgi:PAS domain S-box-containing protein